MSVTLTEEEMLKRKEKRAAIYKILIEAARNKIPRNESKKKKPDLVKYTQITTDAVKHSASEPYNYKTDKLNELNEKAKKLDEEIKYLLKLLKNDEIYSNKILKEQMNEVINELTELSAILRTEMEREKPISDDVLKQINTAFNSLSPNDLSQFKEDASELLGDIEYASKACCNREQDNEQDAETPEEAFDAYEGKRKTLLNKLNKELNFSFSKQNNEAIF